MASTTTIVASAVPLILPLETPTPGPATSAAPTAGIQFPEWLTMFVGPAVIAAVIALFGLVLQAIINYKLAKRASKLELHLRALNEFYAPLRMMLAEVRVLRDAVKVMHDGGEDWHLLDHHTEVLEDPRSRAIVDDLLAVNKRIAKLLEQKSGLSVGTLSGTAEWEVHRRMLDRAFNQPGEIVDPKLSYFPQNFEGAVATRHDKIVTEIEALVGLKARI